MTLESWALSQFSKLGIQNPNEIIKYLIGLDSESLVEEYLNAMLDSSNASDKTFIDEFIKRFSKVKSNQHSGFYRKPDLNHNDKVEKPKVIIKESSPADATTSKKKKFVSLYSVEGASKDVILLPGRYKCDCQASKHKLINNCLKCGRIVCEQEGAGPCSFCKNLVLSKDDENSQKGSGKSVTYDKVKDGKASLGLQKAIEHKDKLLEFDLTSVKRTKVYDDESDYFQLDSRWISPDAKQKLEKYEGKLREKKYNRNEKKVSIDLLGRRVIEEKELCIYDPEDPFVKKILETNTQENISQCAEAFEGLNISRPLYVGSIGILQKADLIAKDILRLQDRELQEMRDDGKCLSMHQPWASLLILGIKKHEGRTWYSAHRGRLWIASGAKSPDPSEVSQVEQMYKVLLNNDNIKFPKNYPTGCLLGCVDVVDVLPQEEYSVKYPDGESSSPYVFICENPQEMVIKFPIKGEHKIYKLDSKIHSTAKKSIGI